MNVIVVGSGIAGLTAALHASAAGHVVSIVTKGDLDDGCTALAQGGVAGVYGPGDSAALHARDTLAAGAGLSDPAAVDVRLLKGKSASLHWEFMFARPLHNTPDLIAQHELLNQAARLIDNGTLRTTLGEHYGKINAENLRRAHAFIESGKARGKIVLEGF